MLRRLLIWFTAFLILFSASSAEEAEPSNFSIEEEEEVDIFDLVRIEEEDSVREKKDSDGAYIMTVTCTGDFTIGGDMNHKDIFSPELAKHDGDVNFVMQNVRNLFLDDDLTLINFEGTLTDSRYKPSSKTKDDYIFSISPSYVTVLTDNSVEAVSLDNNHVWDHGDQGMEDTINALESAGVIYSSPLHTGTFDYKGILQVGLLSFNCIDRYGDGFKKERFRKEYTDEFLQHDTFEEAVCSEIAKAKAIYPLVIVSFHWGLEPTKSNPSRGYIPTKNQINLGHLAVEAGADLIVGNHSHRIQPIECYLGKYICYSLGNFCFAGNSKPSDMLSIIFQIRYRVKEDGSISYRDFRIVPIRISSNTKTNDFIPTILEDGSADGASVDAIINVLRSKENSKDLSDPVTDFPLKFQQ